jgi:hypothetical protein
VLLSATFAPSEFVRTVSDVATVQVVVQVAPDENEIPVPAVSVVTVPVPLTVAHDGTPADSLLQKLRARIVARERHPICAIVIHDIASPRRGRGDVVQVCCVVPLQPPLANGNWPVTSAPRATAPNAGVPAALP